MSTEMKWRDLALQFDGHRMQALGFLKQILQESPETKFIDARNFMKSGPIPAEEILEQRIKQMVERANK